MKAYEAYYLEEESLTVTVGTRPTALSGYCQPPRPGNCEHSLCSKHRSSSFIQTASGRWPVNTIERCQPYARLRIYIQGFKFLIAWQGKLLSNTAVPMAVSVL